MLDRDKSRDFCIAEEGSMVMLANTRRKLVVHTNLVHIY